MLKNILVLTGSIIFALLGIVHLLYTFFTAKFLPADKSTVKSMKTTYPLISSQTTMWKAWIGFNASHSIGLMFFGMINITLVSFYRETLNDDFIIPSFNIIVCLSYLLLAKKYWFKTPLVAIAIATLCFITYFILRLI